MSEIRVTNLTFSYEGSYDDIFHNMTFQIDTDWKLGFIGRNGRGKTTFFNLLLGKYPYQGTISADVDFEYFPYEVSDKTQDTLDIMHTICPQSEDWEFIKELSLLKLEADILYRPFDTLSNGEQTKVLLAALFTGTNRFLLIDEPTNHLDTKARTAVGEYLKRKHGFILVSHDRTLLDTCVDHILSINRANIEIQKGNFSSWWENKQRQDNLELAQNEQLKKEIGRLSESSKRSSDWSDRVESSKNGSTNSGSKLDKGYVGHKAAKMMKRSKSMENRKQTAITEKSKLLHNIESYDSLKLMPLTFQKNVLVRAEKLALYYGTAPITAPVSFAVHQGDRLSVSGKNGCGKSTLLKCICGADITHTGLLTVESGLKISYVAQDTSHLKGTVSDYAKQKDIEESLFKTMLTKLGLARVQFEKDIADFSGGQKKKILLAGSLCEQAHLYVWDEPLNFIDIFSRIQLEELILQYQPTLLFVEHDLSFQNKIATQRITL